MKSSCKAKEFYFLYGINPSENAWNTEIFPRLLQLTMPEEEDSEERKSQQAALAAMSNLFELSFTDFKSIVKKCFITLPNNQIPRSFPTIRHLDPASVSFINGEAVDMRPAEERYESNMKINNPKGDVGH